MDYRNKAIRFSYSNRLLYIQEIYVIFVKLYPNTIEGLNWGLQNFDGVETDLRLTSNKELLIHHNPATDEGVELRTHTREELSQIPSFSDLLENTKVRDNLSNGRTIWVELKPDCLNKKLITKELADIFYQKVFEVIENTNSSSFDLRLLSFSTDLLEPFVDSTLPVFPIIPNVNECTTSTLKLYTANLPKILFKSLKRHIEEAHTKNYGGVMFARQYLIGIFSKFHPSYNKMLELMDIYKIELGTNLGSVELEPSFVKLHRFSDKTGIFPRHGSSGDGQIIGHRGTGTKGVEIATNE